MLVCFFLNIPKNKLLEKFVILWYDCKCALIYKGCDLIPKRIKVTQESDTGRNISFHDNFTGEDMTRSEFVNEIKSGNYKNYHIRKINGVDTPVSNPDPNRNNNLGD